MNRLSEKHLESVIELIRRYRAINESMFTADLNQNELLTVIINNTQNHYDNYTCCILCESSEGFCNKCIHRTSGNLNCLSHETFTNLEYPESVEHAINLCHIRADYLQQLLDEYLEAVK